MHRTLETAFDRDVATMAEVEASKANGKAAASVGPACASPGCTNVVEHLLACPKCLQLGMPPTYFCSQECFRGSYATHKQVHNLVCVCFMDKNDVLTFCQ